MDQKLKLVLVKIPVPVPEKTAGCRSAGVPLLLQCCDLAERHQLSTSFALHLLTSLALHLPCLPQVFSPLPLRMLLPFCSHQFDLLSPGNHRSQAVPVPWRCSCGARAHGCATGNDVLAASSDPGWGWSGLGEPHHYG